MLNIINQVFEMEQKMIARSELLLDRNFKRIYHELEEMGYRIINPVDKPYKESDTDIEASISGEFKPDMKITRVLKPVIYQEQNGARELLQKAIVIVE